MKNTLFIFFLLVIAKAAFTQDLTPARMDSIITKVKAQLKENFVNAAKVKLIADSLNSTQFPGIVTQDAFVRKLNNLLFHYSQDKHLSVQYVPNYAKSLVNKKEDRSVQDRKEKNENYGFDAVQYLPKNVAYVKLRYFADTANAKPAALKMMTEVQRSKALILDLRGNSGGSGSMIQLLCSIFLPKPGAPLLSTAYKGGNQVTLKTIVNKVHYARPVYILTDEKTFSAAEAFTFILKNRHRAVIIGATTAGAGNIAGPYPVDNDFIITIPVGRIIDPLTKTGWETVGVKPDIRSADPLGTAKNLAIKMKKKA